MRRLGLASVFLVSCFLLTEILTRGLDLGSAPRPAIPGSSERASVDYYTAPARIHPYRGFSGIPEVQSSEETDDPAYNLFGFASSITDYRDLSEEEFTVGVLGGSVAAGFSIRAVDRFTRRLGELRPELADSIRVVNLGFGGYKQPQQVMVLTQMIVLGVPLDAVVNLDGFNEVALGGADAKAGHHPYFPSNFHVQALADLAAGTPSEVFIEVSAEVLDHRRSAKALLDWTETSPWRWSAFLRSLAGALAERRLQRAAVLEVNLQGQMRTSSFGASVADLPEECFDEAQACWPLIADLWARSSTLLDAAAESIGAVYLHALQPNQYVADSKVLSDEERAGAYQPESEWSLAARDGYPHLRERADWLRNRGVDFVDLTGIFRETESTIYVDSCCHFNQLGFEMVGGALAEALAEVLPEAKQVSRDG